jgi:hypothetical protein
MARLKDRIRTVIATANAAHVALGRPPVLSISRPAQERVKSSLREEG